MDSIQTNQHLWKNSIWLVVKVEQFCSQTQPWSLLVTSTDPKMFCSLICFCYTKKSTALDGAFRLWSLLYISSLMILKMDCIVSWLAVVWNSSNLYKSHSAIMILQLLHLNQGQVAHLLPDYYCMHYSWLQHVVICAFL